MCFGAYSMCRRSTWRCTESHGYTVFHQEVLACVCLCVTVHVSVMCSQRARGLLSCVHMHLKPVGEISPESLSVFFLLLLLWLSLSFAVSPSLSWHLCLEWQQRKPCLTLQQRLTCSVSRTTLLHDDHLANYRSFPFKLRGFTKERGAEWEGERGRASKKEFYSHYKPIWCNGLPHGAGMTRPLLMTPLHQTLKLPKKPLHFSPTLSSALVTPRLTPYLLPPSLVHRLLGWRRVRGGEIKKGGRGEGGKTAAERVTGLHLAAALIFKQHMEFLVSLCR